MKVVFASGINEKNETEHLVFCTEGDTLNEIIHAYCKKKLERCRKTHIDIIINVPPVSNKKMPTLMNQNYECYEMIPRYNKPNEDFEGYHNYAYRMKYRERKKNESSNESW